ncbi:MAG TPA: MlaD family protein, partial [Pseudonocardia sp.]
MAPSKYAANRFVYGIGALAVIGLLGLMAVTANQARLPWTDPTLVRAQFENIGQLQVGSEVRQNGLKVGQVSKIDVPDGKPVVTIALNDAEPMYRDGYAGIYDQSSLALKFVELRSGNPSSGLLGDAVLPLSQTESTHDLVDVLNIFDPVTRQALSNSLRQIGGGMAGYGPGLHDLTGSLPTMLDNVRTVSATLVSARTDFPGLLRSTDRLVTRFAGREAQLNSLLRQTDVTLRAIGTDDGKPLSATLASLP